MEHPRMNNQPDELQKALLTWAQNESTKEIGSNPYLVELINSAAQRLQQVEKERDEYKRREKNLIEHCSIANGLVSKKNDNAKLTLILQYLNRAEKAEQRVNELEHTIRVQMDALNVSVKPVEQERDQLKAALEECATSTQWAYDFLNKLFTFGEKGGAFLNGTEYAGVERRLDAMNKTLSKPIVQQILKKGGDGLEPT